MREDRFAISNPRFKIPPRRPFIPHPSSPPLILLPCAPARVKMRPTREASNFPAGSIPHFPWPPAMSRMSGDSTDTTAPRRPAPADGRERHPVLVFLRGELIAAPIPLDRDEVTLGRALEADVRVNDARASRMHARIDVMRDAGTGQTQYR